MTEELTAEERVSLATDWPPHHEHISKLLRLYDAALDRAAELQGKWGRRRAYTAEWVQRCTAAESALAEATVLLGMFKDCCADEPRERLRAFLSRTPAPAATAALPMRRRGGFWLRGRCYKCGHRLAFASCNCPQCGIEFAHGREPKRFPEKCECKRCMTAREKRDA